MKRVFSSLLLLIIATCLSFRLQEDWYNLLADVHASKIMSRDLPRDTRFLSEIAEGMPQMLSVIIVAVIMAPSFAVVMWAQYKCRNRSAAFDLSTFAFCLGAILAVSWLADISLCSSGVPRYFATYVGDSVAVGPYALSMLLAFAGAEILYVVRKRLGRTWML